MDEKLCSQNWKLEIPPLMHFSAFEFYCFAAFCMNREQQIISAHTHPTDLVFMGTYRLHDNGPTHCMEKCKVYIK